MQWTPQELWAGEDAFIIGGGPSLRSFDWTKLIGRRTIGCNDAFRLGPEVCSICVFGDLRWFNIHRKSLEQFPNPIFTNQDSLHTGKGMSWVKTLRRAPAGLYKDALGWGGNTGCSAINLALILGANRVFLLGFDLKIVEGKTNWHDMNIGKPDETTYRRFLQGFRAVARDLPKKFPGRSVVNLSEISTMDVFPKMKLEEVLSCAQRD